MKRDGAVASAAANGNGVVGAPVSAAVVSLLHALTSSDNAARNQAEQAFNGLKDGQPEALVYGLLEVSGVLRRGCCCCCVIHPRRWVTFGFAAVRAVQKQVSGRRWLFWIASVEERSPRSVGGHPILPGRCTSPVPLPCAPPAAGRTQCVSCSFGLWTSRHA